MQIQSGFFFSRLARMRWAFGSNSSIERLIREWNIASGSARIKIHQHYVQQQQVQTIIFKLWIICKLRSAKYARSADVPFCSRLRRQELLAFIYRDAYYAQCTPRGLTTWCGYFMGLRNSDVFRWFWYQYGSLIEWLKVL